MIAKVAEWPILTSKKKVQQFLVSAIHADFEMISKLRQLHTAVITTAKALKISSLWHPFLFFLNLRNHLSWTQMLVTRE